MATYNWKYTNIRLSPSEFKQLPEVKVWSGDGKRILVVRLYKMGRKYAYLVTMPDGYVIKKDKKALIGYVNPQKNEYEEIIDDILKRALQLYGNQLSKKTIDDIKNGDVKKVRNDLIIGSKTRTVPTILYDFFT